MDQNNNIFNNNNNPNNPNSASPAPNGQPFSTANASTTTTGNVFNGMNVNNTAHINTNIPSQPAFNAPQSSQAQPQSPAQPPQSPQPFFGFSNEPESSTNTIPQIPTPGDSMTQQFPPNQGVITPTAPLKKSKKPAAPGSPEQTIHKFTILSIVLGITTVICLFLGVWGLVDAIATRSQLAQSNDALDAYSAIINELETQTGATITSVDSLPVYVPSTDYVYITDWDVKLKIPDTLTSISYILNQNAGYHSYICFNAVQEGVQYFPAFADINQNRAGLGCLYRIPVSDGDRDSAGVSYGQNVFTVGDNNYFYKEPANLYSGSEAEKGLESTAVQLVKTMIVDNISEYR